ncbi:MAG: hypothetical protein IJR54_02250 [Oscillibacter sp.]|nr:hypothetical protein [Oscillibacter sp.]
MKEYRVAEAKNGKAAEKLMNEMARDGWEVVSVTYWSYWKTCLLVTFARKKTENYLTERRKSVS